jgi:hypothetical protein
MGENNRTYEKPLYDLWLKQEFNDKLYTADDEEIEVLSPGELNAENSGPDFRNAKIRIGSIIYVGDVEIDLDYTRWKNHAHNINSHYNHVILHVVLNNKYNYSYVYSKGGRKIPTLTLRNYISEDYINALKNQELKEPVKKSRLKCAGESDQVDYFVKEKFVAELGMNRFKKKMNRYFHRLLELKYLDQNLMSEPKINYELPPEYENKDFDREEFSKKELWEQLFYEFLFEALGYSKNKEPMKKLAELADLNFLRKIGTDDNFLVKLQAVLFRISGLFEKAAASEDENINSYQQKLEKSWNDLNGLYDSDYLDETDWQFFRMRPQNFPTIRIAAGSYFLSEILTKNFVSHLINLVGQNMPISEMIKKIRGLFIVRSFGFWRYHFTFYKNAKTEIRYFIGLGRADEIVVNVVLPFLALYFQVFGLSEHLKKVLKIYNLYSQRSEYALVDDIASVLGLQNLVHRTVFVQGMLDLYRSYCSKGKCLECKIGEKIF